MDWISSAPQLGIFFVGADYRIAPGLLIGAMAQFDMMSDQDDTRSTNVTGSGWMAGPSLTAKLSDNLYFDARGAWGTSSNQVTPFGTYTDTFDTERWLAKANLTGDWRFGALRISPSVGVVYASETQESYVDTPGVTIPEQTSSVGRMTFGPEIGYTFQTSEGLSIEPHVAVTGIWDFAKNNEMSSNGIVTSGDEFRVKSEAGVVLRGETGASLRAVATYDGIGSGDYSAWGGEMWVNVPIETLQETIELAARAFDAPSYVGSEPFQVAQAATATPVDPSAAPATSVPAEGAATPAETPEYNLPTVVIENPKKPQPVAKAPKAKKPAPQIVEDQAPPPQAAK